MKMVYLNCNISTLNELRKILEECKIRSYQIVEGVKSRNREGDPRFDNSVWPGYDSIVFVPLKNPDNKDLIFERIKKFNEAIVTADEKIYACSFDLDDAIF